MRSVCVAMQQEAGKNGDIPADLEDQAGITMRFLRAAERGHVGCMRACSAKFPRLEEVCTEPLALGYLRGKGLEPYKALAVELARGAALQALTNLHEDRGQLDDAALLQPRDRIHRMLRRIAPGRTSTLPAVQARDGTVVMEPEQMAAVLREHWRQVFSR